MISIESHNYRDVVAARTYVRLEILRVDTAAPNAVG
jgi:hypothetical protein